MTTKEKQPFSSRRFVIKRNGVILRALGPFAKIPLPYRVLQCEACLKS
jgi:hypothetical protein